MQIKWPHRGESKLRNSSVPEDCFILENSEDPGSPLFIKVPVVGFQYTWGNKKTSFWKGTETVQSWSLCEFGVVTQAISSSLA